MESSYQPIRLHSSEGGREIAPPPGTVSAGPRAAAAVPAYFVLQAPSTASRAAPAGTPLFFATSSQISRAAFLTAFRSPLAAFSHTPSSLALAAEGSVFADRMLDLQAVIASSLAAPVRAGVELLEGVLGVEELGAEPVLGVVAALFELLLPQPAISAAPISMAMSQATRPARIGSPLIEEARAYGSVVASGV